MLPWTVSASTQPAQLRTHTLPPRTCAGYAPSGARGTFPPRLAPAVCLPAFPLLCPPRDASLSSRGGSLSVTRPQPDPTTHLDVTTSAGSFSPSTVASLGLGLGPERGSGTPTTGGNPSRHSREPGCRTRPEHPRHVRVSGVGRGRVSLMAERPRDLCSGLLLPSRTTSWPLCPDVPDVTGRQSPRPGAVSCHGLTFGPGQATVPAAPSGPATATSQSERTEPAPRLRLETCACLCLGARTGA